MTLSEMRQTLATRGIRLTKSLGQNFLHDGNQLRRIVDAAGLRGGDKVLEIGPGLGPLTERLLATGASVLALEKDARLVTVLREHFRGTDRLTLEAVDALEYVREHRDWGGWKVVSNLPYSVASPILVELAQARLGPERVVATVQLEVARRILARPGSPDYGLLTLLLTLRFVPREVGKISASCFYPQPDVDSACVLLEPRTVGSLPEDLAPCFRRIVKRAFSQRRKMMLKLLKEDWPAPVLEDAFRLLHLPPATRAEVVGLEQFVRLTERLAAVSPAT